MSDYINLKDFASSYIKTLDNEIIDALSDEVVRIGMSYCVWVYDEKKCKDWIAQALEIENFSKEQIEDLKIRHLIDKKDEKIEELKKDIEWYKNKLNEISEIVGE